MKRLWIGAGLVVMAASVAHAGIAYTAVTRATGSGADMQGGKIKGLVDGMQARVEFVESAKPMAKSGGFAAQALRPREVMRDICPSWRRCAMPAFQHPGLS